MARPGVVDLLLFGGRRDPNIACLAQEARRQGLTCLWLDHDEAEEPHLTWDLSSSTLALEGRRIEPASAFLRYDVFSPVDEGASLDRPYGWFTSVASACHASAGTRLFNRNMAAAASHKPLVLSAARDLGLTIPATLVSNVKSDIDAFHAAGRAVAKPVGGGAYCVELPDAAAQTDWTGGRAPMPCLVQERLDYPEYRVFRIGADILSFEIRSDHLDYRTHQSAGIRVVDDAVIGSDLIAKLVELSDAFGIDFFACDLKTRPGDKESDKQGDQERDREIVFLEMNTNPMFVAHNAVSHGRLASMIVTALARNR